jgi:hypothetical protein
MMMIIIITIIIGSSDIGAINSSDRIAATLCSLGTWFVSGNSDDDDNNNNNNNRN